MAKLFQQLPDDEISRLGMEIDRFMHEAHLSVTEVSRESHFGFTKFNEFKKAS